MIRILLKIWPALIPVIIYFIWLYLASKKDIKVHDEFFEKKKRYKFYTLVATGLMIILLLLWEGITLKPSGGNFIPTHTDEKGNIIPSEIK